MPPVWSDAWRRCNTVFVISYIIMRRYEISVDTINENKSLQRRYGPCPRTVRHKKMMIAHNIISDVIIIRQVLARRIIHQERRGKRIKRGKGRPPNRVPNPVRVSRRNGGIKG
jgi:hypothetical protein